jgi:hypothetical protein
MERLWRDAKKELENSEKKMGVLEGAMQELDSTHRELKGEH